MHQFSGTWPALVTPYTADNAINVDTVVKLVSYHLEKNVGGFYVCGSTGSGVYQSVAERKLMAETALKTVAGRVPVVVHVGAVALVDAIDLARHAQEHGAAAFSSIIPPLYPHMSDVLDYYEALASAVPDFSFFPYLARPEVNALDLVRKLIHLPNVVGTKYTGPNMYEFKQIASLRDENWSVFSGMDEQSIFAAMSGSCGHIGSTLNFMPGAYARIRAHVLAGEHDSALSLQQQANAVTRVLLNHDFGGTLYETMSILGFDCGTPRLPWHPLSAEDKETFRTELEAAGFWDVAKM
ncbi:MAG TPA: dihydrodipicolinate synthase family protein [Aggregatilinea sp.]|uniref:dihydrodipicolinate synthase family protein n=1 Tax=Aggregatilinea sp. TaxID=2806333 RepID=UPI002BD32758|nr:dihydrodipicolinate synthase family protein [Aggregatilinea sp.]HML20296.1 dihydrodipicolinate synthase family protein [Aggregatilinea sp.]